MDGVWIAGDIPGSIAAVVHVPELPEALVLAPYRSVLQRAGLALQIGLDPDAAVEVSGLSAGTLRLVTELRRVQPTAALLDRAARWGVPQQDAVELLAELVAAGAVVDAERQRRVGQVRAGARVRVHGDGPLAAAITDGLVAAGVGTVYAAPAGAARRRVPDLVLLADVLVPAPEVLAALLDARVPHLPVRLRDGKGLIGPLVLPGRTSCLRCLELHRAARDECWPLVAAQLVDQRGDASAAGTAATAALGGEQALLALDAVLAPACGAPPATLQTVLELDTALGVLGRRHVPAHPSCCCRAVTVR